MLVAVHEVLREMRIIYAESAGRVLVPQVWERDS